MFPFKRLVSCSPKLEQYWQTMTTYYSIRTLLCGILHLWTVCSVSHVPLSPVTAWPLDTSLVLSLFLSFYSKLQGLMFLTSELEQSPWISWSPCPSSLMCFAPFSQSVFETISPSWPGDLPATLQWLYITPTLRFLHVRFLATDKSHEGSSGQRTSHTLWIKAEAESTRLELNPSVIGADRKDPPSGH